MLPTLTTGNVCRRLGVLPWQLNRTIRRGFLEEPPRLGCYRVFTESDLPRVREALTRAGYLPGEVRPSCA
jgi:hypothetical protein